jgi:hypothetical protein
MVPWAHRPSTKNEQAPHRPESERIVRILARHPNLTPEETNEIVRYLRDARYVDIARLAVDESIRRQLDSVVRAHRHEIGSRPIKLFAAALLIILLVASILLLSNQFG